MALRNIRESDLKLILKWRNHPSVRLCMFSQDEIQYEAHKAWFEKEKNSRNSKWLIYKDKEGNPLGVVSFTQIDTHSNHAFWGFYKDPLSPPGTGKIMCNEALIYCFDILGLNKINAEVLESNVVSQKFHESLGFVVEGVFKEHYFSNGKYESIIRFARKVSD